MSQASKTNVIQRWCFTLNNYTEDEYKKIVTFCDESKPTYAVIGKEVGEKGTPHLQGYLNLGAKRQRLTAMKKLIGLRAHLEVAQGDDLQNQKYCTKDNDFVEFGVPQFAGKRNDLQGACDLLKESKKVNDVALTFSSTYVKYHRGFEALQSQLTAGSPRNWKTKVTVLVGPPGSGKSRYCAGIADRDYKNSTYYKPRGEWWDGYEGDECVIIDDFYGWLKYDELLKITDRYPYRVPVKGGYRQFVAKCILITSNVDIEEWYHFNGYNPAALKRRIDLHCLNWIPMFERLANVIDDGDLSDVEPDDPLDTCDSPQDVIIIE